MSVTMTVVAILLCCFLSSASFKAQRPSLFGMLVYNALTSIVTKYDSSGSSPNVLILLMKSVVSLTNDLSDWAESCMIIDRRRDFTCETINRRDYGSYWVVLFMDFG